MENYSDEDLNESLNDLRYKKKLLMRQVTDLDTKIIGIKEELRRRDELKDKSGAINYDENEGPSY